MNMWIAVPWVFIFLAGVCFHCSSRDRSIKCPTSLKNKYIQMAMAFMALSVFTVYQCKDYC